MDHFDSVAVVKGWTADDKKKWIWVRIKGRAAIAYNELSANDQLTHDKTTAALKNRFEPECHKELFIAEFHQRKKRRAEDWAAFGDDLLTLVEKAYPTLQPETQELLALNHLLSQIENTQLEFTVRPRAPTMVYTAAAVALELETYMGKAPAPITQVLQSGDDVIAATGRGEAGGWALQDMVQVVLRWLDKLEQRTGTQNIPIHSHRGQGAGACLAVANGRDQTGGSSSAGDVGKKATLLVSAPSRARANRETGDP